MMQLAIFSCNMQSVRIFTAYSICIDASLDLGIHIYSFEFAFLSQSSVIHRPEQIFTTILLKKHWWIAMKNKKSKATWNCFGLSESISLPIKKLSSTNSITVTVQWRANHNWTKQKNNCNETNHSCNFRLKIYVRN